MTFQEQVGRITAEDKFLYASESEIRKLLGDNPLSPAQMEGRLRANLYADVTLSSNRKRTSTLLSMGVKRGDGRIVFPLYHILIVLSVVVSIRPRFPFQKLFLAGKVLAGQADDDFIGIHINDGIGVFLIQRIDAFSIKHFVPPFRCWVVGEPSQHRRRTTADRKTKKGARTDIIARTSALIVRESAREYCCPRRS